MSDKYAFPNALMGEMEKMRKKIKELEAEVKRLEEELRISREAHADTMRQQAERILELEAEVKRLREGIEKHREEKEQSMILGSNGFLRPAKDDVDEELYKLIEQ